jgi:molybdopterin-guanine dinucleotide biosynthesis protein A
MQVECGIRPISQSKAFTAAHSESLMDSLKVMILAGGHSSRMGSPKHLLPLPHGPLYLYLIHILHEALPNVATVHMSLADRSTTDETLRNGKFDVPDVHGSQTTVAIETVTDSITQDIGPAAGLLAAHERDPAATWLVVACDFPLLRAEAVRQLIQYYEEPATCFRNEEGFTEPLLGIWGPRALEELKENVKAGRSGPSYTLKNVGSKLLVPNDQNWLVNVNTKQEWEAVQDRIKLVHRSDAS